MRLVAAGALLALVGASADRRAPGLNHAYVVLDRETFDAIRNSAGLAAVLGPADAGLPAYAPPERSADRFFLRGRATYLELFAPGNRFGEPVGKVGIGIGADTSAGFGLIEAGWRRACGGGLRRETISWTRMAPPIPWYETLYCDATASGGALVLWAMLYRPEFAGWQTGRAAIDRRALLAPRAAAGQGRFDVTGLTLDVAPALYATLAPQLVRAGFQRRRTAEGIRFAGEGWSLTLREGRPRLRAIDLRTAAEGPGRIRLGAARFVRTGGDTARLRFE